MFTKLLLRIFVPENEHPEKPSVRAAYGIFTGYVGVAVNVFLFAVKLTIGILSGSVAVAADAVNNLSDAGSGVVTVIGFKLAAKPADPEHPFGHGRIELCCGVVVSVIIMMMGLDFLKEAVGKILSGGKVDMPPLLCWFLAGSLLFKLWLFFFYRYVGKRIDSGTIIASAFDSLSDMAGTTVVLLAVIAAKYTSFPVDGVAGVLVAIMVIIAGGNILRDAISPLLGEPPGKQFIEELQENLLKCEGIKGIHDIIVHNYGPNQYFATAHAEVEMNSDLLSVHDMLESAEVEIGRKMPVHLLLHCDPFQESTQEIRTWRVRLENATARLEPHFKLYDFRLKKNEEKLILTCHILIPQNYRMSNEEIHATLSAEMAKYSPAPELQITFIHPYI